mmetsp:Transcript_6872/g.19259  ORF Transcript_6872/g.19259 Transcript_6872/m.19259 type:complete len:305 (+) Transcript_6872:72-986(+)
MHGSAAMRSSGSIALSSTRGAHPTMRLDTFLRNTDTSYQPAEGATQGDHFIRKMATYGSIRPSASFAAEPRVIRPMQEHQAIDKSHLPANWNDPREDDPRHGTLSIPQPPKEVNGDFINAFKNDALMLPSERYKEHIYMKEAQEQWKADRAATFNYKKRMTILERKHPEGILGMDGPLHPGTRLYAQQRAHLVAAAERKEAHSQARFAHLHDQSRADDATACRHYGSDPGLPRSMDVGIQQKQVIPAAHPHRFMDTHDRLFPGHLPTWDPERAKVARGRDVRDKQYNIINGGHNALTFNVATFN